MQNSRVALIAGVTLVVILGVSGCSSATKTTSTPVSASPSSTPQDTSSYIGHEIDPVGTTWAGTDSGGDASSFTLQDDHTVAVTYTGHSFDDPADTWAVVDGTLQLHVFINHTDGTLDYTGQYDVASRTVVASATTSLTGKKITVSLAEK